MIIAVTTVRANLLQANQDRLMRKHALLIAAGGLAAASGSAFAGLIPVAVPVGSPLSLIALGVVGAVLVARFVKRR